MMKSAHIMIRYLNAATVVVFLLNLTEFLMSLRSVRFRLPFKRYVEMHVIREPRIGLPTRGQKYS